MAGDDGRRGRRPASSIKRTLLGRKRFVTVILILLLTGAVLVALFWAMSSTLQAFLYNEAAPGLLWRAPAAAAAVTLFLALWCYLDYRTVRRSDPPYDAPFYVSGTATKVYAEFWAANIGPDGRQSKLEHYILRNGEYVRADPPYRRWEPTDVVVVRDDGGEARFLAERDAKGNYVRQRRPPPRGLGWVMPAGAQQPLRYTDGSGRVMTEDTIGRITTARWGTFWVSVLLTLLHLAIWFLAIWLLLRFQWMHALGIGIVLWGLMTLVFMHMLVTAVQTEASRASQGTAAMAACVPNEPARQRMCMTSPSCTT